MAPQVTITAVDSFTGKLAVVTGGGSGIGRELVRQLAAQGCSVATCDLNPDSVAVTAATAWAAAPAGVAVTGHRCDVSDESQVQRFRDELLARHATDHVDLVFSNAAIGGGSSARALLPLLIAGGDGVLVDTSSLDIAKAIAPDGLLSPAGAAAIILDGVRWGAWRTTPACQ